ncbi:sphingosine kinase [Microlunatus endophyticus]|uniref:Sphingosine kinase n=1 Tax=Microlunatus endophyticus TaxID=1716077 RepID=A0A917W680_9ACTN|nr:diacylglycerol kinase family protein [Microlunatus endophyticus]GGL73691.1 sphingosine kinase [Microlunatus endophyticus]
MPVAAVVVNPTNVNLGRLRDAVQRAQQAAGWNPSRWFFTARDDSGRRAARDALEASPDVVLVVGGDGTVRTTAQELRRTVPVTIVPAGTGNLLARNLRLPLTDLDQAVSAAFTGQDRHIDVIKATLEHETGKVVEHIFLAMAGVGLDAAMALHSNTSLKSLVGWLAYVPPIARSILSNQSFDVRYRINHNDQRSMTAHTMIIGNCGVLTGDVVLMPAAAVDDGLLDVVILRPGRRLSGWTPIGIRLAANGAVHRRRHRLGKTPRGLPSSRSATHAQAREFEATFDQPQLIELDGDIIDHITRAQFTLLPGELTLRTPLHG